MGPHTNDVLDEAARSIRAMKYGSNRHYTPGYGKNPACGYKNIDGSFKSTTRPDRCDCPECRKTKKFQEDLRMFREGRLVQR